MRELHHVDLWIPRDEALRIVAAGEQYLKSYAYLAHLCAKLGEPKFPLKPKQHMIHETVEAMKRGIHTRQYTLNMLAESCSMDEDFVGRLARVSRHVSPRAQSLRCLQRYLTQVYLVWREKRPE